jgi:hypothetical protein
VSRLRKAWVWFKKYWREFFLGLFSLSLGFALLRWNQERPELEPGEDPKKKPQEDEDKRVAKAKEVHTREIAEIEKKHAQKLQNLTDQQKADVETLKDDPDKLNAYLLSVGEGLR